MKERKKVKNFLLPQFCYLIFLQFFLIINPLRAEVQNNLNVFLDVKYHLTFTDKKVFEKDLGLQLGKRLNRKYQIKLQNDYKVNFKKYTMSQKPFGVFILNGFEEVIDQYLEKNSSKKCKENLAQIIKNNKISYAALLSPLFIKIKKQINEITKNKGDYRVYWIGGKLSGPYLFFDRLKCTKEDMSNVQVSDAYVHFLDYMAINEPSFLVTNYLNIDFVKKKRPLEKIPQVDFVNFLAEGLSPFLIDTY